jgi:hypothetical protein
MDTSTHKDPLKELEKAITVGKYYTKSYPEGSIMAYEEICDHDSGYLCEHRRQWILNYIQEHFTPKTK